MREVVIVSAVRTPVGSFGGALKEVKASTLGAITVKAAIERAGISANIVQEMVYGCVLQGGLGQNIARQASIEAGLPIEVPSLTINKVCGSGLRAVSLAAQMIQSGDVDVMIAGGTESMSNAGYATNNARRVPEWVTSNGRYDGI